MMLESQVPQDSLVTITVDKVGLITMISAAHKAINKLTSGILGMSMILISHHSMR